MILLEFFETLCPHCRAFTAILKQVETRYANRLNIVAVVNPPDLPASVSELIRHPVDYPILLDRTGSPSLCSQARPSTSPAYS